MNREHWWKPAPAGAGILEAYVRCDGALVYKMRGNMLGTYSWHAKTADGTKLKRKGGASRVFRTADGAIKAIETISPLPEGCRA